jgi:hypothetical protein
MLSVIIVSILVFLVWFLSKEFYKRCKRCFVHTYEPTIDTNPIDDLDNPLIYEL